jgi:predicted nucleic acid-binding protein
MISVLVDTNIFIDVFGPPAEFLEWSSKQLSSLRTTSSFVLSPVVWAELAGMRESEAHLATLFSRLDLTRETLPFSAAYRAGLAHRNYRTRGGARERTLPDFLIGAHALIRGHQLLTRDPGRYRTYFPELPMISPETHP